MKKKFFILCQVALLLSFRVGVLCAQTSTEYFLNEAVKVEHRKHVSLRSSMPSFQLDTMQLKRMATTDLANTLRHVAGLNVRDYGGAGGLKTISVRGIGAAHTTVCYDGLPMATTQNGAVDVGTFAFEQINSLRLDIGDATPLLTPVKNLSAATLHINTMAENPKNAVSVQLKTGSWEMVNPSVSVSQLLNKKWAIGGSSQFYFRNNNYPFRIENGILSTTSRRNNSRVRSSVNEGWVQGKLSEHQQLKVKAYYSYSHNQLPGAVVLYNNQNHEVMKDATWFLQSHYEGNWNSTQVNAAVKLQGQKTFYTDDNPQYPKDALRQRYLQHEYYATIGASHKLTNSWSIAYAADYFHNTLSTHITDADGAFRHTLQQALSLRFQQKQWLLTGRWIAHDVWNHSPKENSVAARNMHKWQSSFSAAYKFRKPQFTLRFFYKDYYRQPTFSENYFYHLGTAQLKPERTQQWGAGVTWKDDTEKLNVAATVDGYYNNITDRITSVPYNLFVWRTENRGKVRIAGVDATLQANYLFNSRHKIYFSTNYSLQRGADKTSPSELTYNKQPAYLPKHSGALNVSWENPWVNITVGLTAASERWATTNHAPQTQLPGYAEVNAALTRDFRLGSGVLTAGLFVNNVLDKSYEIVRRYPMPLRNYMFSFKLRL